MRERSTLESISFFSIARYLSEALLLVRGFCLAKILGPALFGVWTQMKLLLLFMQYGRLGTSEAMQREFPYVIGEGRRDRAERVMTTTFWFNVMSALVITGVILAVVKLKETIWNSELKGVWIAFAGIFFITQIYWFIYFKFLTEKKFKQTIKIMLWPVVLSTTIGLLAVLYLNFLGFLIALGLSYLLTIMMSNDGRFPFPKFDLDKSILGELISIGFPIMISGALLILLWNVDKLAIWILMSKESLGIYTLQFYIASAMMMVPESVSRILYPMLMENFGKNKSLMELERYLVQPTLAISYLACPLLGILFLTLHLPIKWLLPKYILAIRPGEILILAIFFMMIARMPATILVSVNKQRLLLLLTGFSVMVGATANYLMIKTGKGLIGVAIGTFLSFATYSLLIMINSLNTLKFSKIKCMKFFGLLFSPYFLVIFLLSISFFIMPKQGITLVNDMTYTGIRCLIIIIPIGVLFLLISKRFPHFKKYILNMA